MFKQQLPSRANNLQSTKMRTTHIHPACLRKVNYTRMMMQNVPPPSQSTIWINTMSIDVEKNVSQPLLCLCLQQSCCWWWLYFDCPSYPLLCVVARTYQLIQHHRQSSFSSWIVLHRSLRYSIHGKKYDVDDGGAALSRRQQQPHIHTRHQTTSLRATKWSYTCYASFFSVSTFTRLLYTPIQI